MPSDKWSSSSVAELFAVLTTAAAFLALTVAVPARAQAVRDPAFEVASIKPNSIGFIDLGRGLRLLRGETRCQATDTPAIPGDPLPPPGPGRCTIRNSTVKEMIDVAYELRFGPARPVLNQMIVGGPSWTETAVFDVDAKAESPTVTMQQMRGMLRTMLAERFHLTSHRESRQLTGLALVVAKDGHKLKEAAANGQPSFVAAPVVRGQSVPVGVIATLLSQRLGRPVADETKLTGRYDFSLTWTPDPLDLGPNGLPIGADSADRASGALVTALQEQLGLRLETRRVAVDAFIIDSIAMPTPN